MLRASAPQLTQSWPPVYSRGCRHKSHFNHDSSGCAYSGGIKNLSKFTEVYTRDISEGQGGSHWPDQEPPNSSPFRKPNPEPETPSSPSPLPWVPTEHRLLGAPVCTGTQEVTLGALRVRSGDPPRWPIEENEIQDPAGGWESGRKGSEFVKRAGGRNQAPPTTPSSAENIKYNNKQKPQCSVLPGPTGFGIQVATAALVFLAKAVLSKAGWGAGCSACSRPRGPETARPLGRLAALGLGPRALTRPSPAPKQLQ